MSIGLSAGNTRVMPLLSDSRRADIAFRLLVDDFFFTTIKTHFLLLRR